MLIDLLDADVPSLDRVALLAVGSELALVDVGVAVGALVAYVGEDRLDVALGACHVLVQTAQRKLRLAVIEFGNRPDGAPANCTVAVLTGHTQISMWTVGDCVLLYLPRSCRSRGQKHHRKHELHHHSRKHRTPPQRGVDSNTAKMRS